MSASPAGGAEPRESSASELPRAARSPSIFWRPSSIPMMVAAPDLPNSGQVLVLPNAAGADRPDLAAGRHPPARLVDALPAFLAEVARQPSSAAAASAIARALVSRLGARSAAVHVAEPERRLLRRIASASAGHGAAQGPDTISLDASLPPARAARVRRLQLDHGASPQVAIPLLAGDHLLGTVSGELAARPSAGDLAALHSLGVVLGGLVDRTCLQFAAESRDGWTRAVAHELAQPLTCIGLYAQLLALAVEGGAAEESVESLRSEVARLTGLVRGLRHTERVELERIAFRLRPTDLGRLARELVEQPDADGPSGVRLEARGDVSAVPVAPELIRHVLASLVTHALEHRREGTEVRLVVERHRTEVHLSVTHHCTDLPDRSRTLLLGEPGARQGVVGGPIVDLAACRGIVAAHGGRLSTESRGGAATHCIELPVSGI